MPLVPIVQDQPVKRRVQHAMPSVLPSPHSIGASAQAPSCGTPGGHTTASGRAQPCGHPAQPSALIDDDLGLYLDNTPDIVGAPV